jgi:hypothetical protein
MLSTMTSTSQGRRVPLFFGSLGFLFLIAVSLLTWVYFQLSYAAAK